jgi:hypothetical protein
MKKLFLLATVVSLLATSTVTQAKNGGVSISKVATENVYQGYAYTEDINSILYFYGPYGGSCTEVRDSNGNLVDATVNYVELCGLNFVKIILNSGSKQKEFFTDRYY